MKKAGTRKYGKTTLQQIVQSTVYHMSVCSYLTVIIEAKKPARDEFTAWRDPAREESIVSTSLPNLLSIRPVDPGLAFKPTMQHDKTCLEVWYHGTGK